MSLSHLPPPRVLLLNGGTRTIRGARGELLNGTTSAIFLLSLFCLWEKRTKKKNKETRHQSIYSIEDGKIRKIIAPIATTTKEKTLKHKKSGEHGKHIGYGFSVQPLSSRRKPIVQDVVSRGRR